MNADEIERLKHILKKNRSPGPPAIRSSGERCQECNSHVTKTKRLGEVGHDPGCPRRTDHYNGGVRR